MIFLNPWLYLDMPSSRRNYNRRFFSVYRDNDPTEGREVTRFSRPIWRTTIEDQYATC